MKRITLLDLTSGEAMPVCASAPLLSSAKHGWAHLSFEHHFTRPREIPRVALHDFGVCLELSSAASALGLRRLSTGQSRQSQFEICVVPPLAEIKPQFIDSHLEMLYLHLDPLFMRRIAAETAESDWREMRMKLTAFDPTLQHLLFALKHELAADCRNGSLFADSIAAAFAVHLLKNYSSAKIAPETGGLPPRVLRRVVEFINDNLTEDLILSDIAKIAGKSQYHLTRLFKQQPARQSRATSNRSASNSLKHCSPTKI